MRICLLTGDGYPYHRDALGDWCHTLVAELAGHTFELVSLVDGRRPVMPAYPRTPNVASARTLPTAGAERRATTGPATTAAALLCRGLLSEQTYAHRTVTAGLRGLADVAARTRGGPLDGVPLADLLVQAWHAGAAAAAVDRLPLPRLSLRDARTAATLLHRALGGLGTRLPAADLVHCVGGTVPLLAALAAHWRTGTPLLITGPLPQAGRLTVDGQRHDEPDAPLAVRTLVRRFRRAVLRAGCAEATLVAPMSARQRGWAVRHGTPPVRLVTVPPGVRPGPAATGQGTGRPAADGAAPRPAADGAAPRPAADGAARLLVVGGGPGGALAVVLECFARVLAAEPGTVLHATDVTGDRRAAYAAQVARSGLGAAVCLTAAITDSGPGDGRPDDSGPGDSGPGDGRPGDGRPGDSGPGDGRPGDGRPGAAAPRRRPGGSEPDSGGAGTPVVVHVPAPGETPYRLIEAMMAGNAIVGADAADVAETLGDAGVVVPADDPGGLAAACVELLRRPARRHALATAARRRALARFTAAHLARGYDALYTDLAAPQPAAAYEMTLALPAPRSPSSTAVFGTPPPCP